MSDDYETGYWQDGDTEYHTRWDCPKGKLIPEESRIKRPMITNLAQCETCRRWDASWEKLRNP
jgi:hypothetical protein